MKHTRLRLVAATVGLLATLFSPVPRAAAYVEIPYALGRIMAESTNIVVLRVETVDKQKNTIVYKKVRDLKGTLAGDTVKHNIAQNGFNPREWQNVMAWAEPGKHAVFFSNGSASETCIENYWYQAYPGDWWNMSHAEPYMLRSYCGKPEKLATAVEQMLKGQEVLVPCMVDGDKNALQLRTAKLQRMKASAKIIDYDAKRDFAGWGVEEFRAISGMPAFLQYGALARTDPGATGVAFADIDGDGKPDFCLYGAGRAVVLQNGGGSLNEIRLSTETGARAADWADYSGDGKPDLLLATPTGPKLFTNLGKGNFRDDSAGLPAQPYYNLTAGAWIDYDGDGKPDVLLADGFQGLRLYRNIGGKVPPPLELAAGKWMQCGPFDNPQGTKGVETAYPPEKKIDLAGEYPGKNGQKATWRESPLADGQMTSVKIYRDEDHANMAIYLYREITTNRAVSMPVSLGSGGTIAVWLNGERLLNVKELRAPAPDQDKLTLKLKPGKNDLLIKTCFGEHNREFYYAATPVASTDVIPQLFEDVSDKLGLGTSGAGAILKGDHLIVADVNGDGRPDVLFTGGSGVLLINTPGGFVAAKDSGLSFKTGRIAPAFSPAAKGKPPEMLLVPQPDGCKLFRNDGKGHFADVTAKSGDLARFTGNATSAAWVDLTGTGKPGLLVGCLKAPNRFFRNNGDGTFTDATDETGLYQKIFNTRAVAVFDFNNDGTPDVIFNNEGQESCLLVGRPPARVASAGK